ncbi:hypothetical protein HWV62_9841 [Athelia sp. TMB]|nr:hypothetical protein HWV62_9841 [Athelia sp. TMB]
MEPAAPLLEWKQLMDYAFVSEFELLKHRHSHINIIREPWAEPGNREMTTKYYKLRGARVEIIRCNIEARRLATSIRDEHTHFDTTIQHLRDSDPLLASALQQQYDTRRRVNIAHLARLEELYNLSGFSGLRGCGVRAADETDPSVDGVFHAPPAATDEVEQYEDGGLPEDENPSEDEEEPDEAMQSLLTGLESIVMRDDSIPAHMLGGWDSSQL